MLVIIRHGLLDRIEFVIQVIRLVPTENGFKR